MINYENRPGNVIKSKKISLFLKLYFRELFYKILYFHQSVQNFLYLVFVLKRNKKKHFSLSGFYDLNNEVEIQKICNSIGKKWFKKINYYLDLQEKNKLDFKVVDDIEILKDKDILSLALSRELRDIIETYLNSKVEIAKISIWLSKKNKLHGSPNFHLDSAGYGNSRLYVYLSNVRDGCGEFTYIEKEETKKIIKNSGYQAKSFSDEELLKYTSKEKFRKILGIPGKAFLIDTTRCLHMGSRCIVDDRFVLIINFQKWSAKNSPVNYNYKHLNK